MEEFGVVAVVISICALMLTLYESIQTRKSLREQTYQGFINTWFELGKIFIEYPELRKYFYDKHELIEDDENFQRAMAIAVFYDDCFAYAESQSKNIPKNLKKSYDTYKNEIKSRDVYLKYKNKYGKWINT